jgi:hypothetical protein
MDARNTTIKIKTMNDYLFLKICFCCACFGWVWVNKLTNNYGLLNFIPNYYPRFIEPVLLCSFCLAGWLSIIITLLFMPYNEIYSYIYLINAPFITMVLVGFIEKLIIIKV